MSRYINADALENAMYNKAFETDTEMQRWDSGCWIRYKLFETVLEELPTVDVVEVVRCKDCIHMNTDKCPSRLNDADFYCCQGERRTNEI